MIDSHVTRHYEELTRLIMDGISLVIDGNAVHFNIVCFFVAILCFVKDFIDVCACTSTYGFYHCLLKRERTVKELEEALEIFSDNLLTITLHYLRKFNWKIMDSG